MELAGHDGFRRAALGSMDTAQPWAVANGAPTANAGGYMNGPGSGLPGDQAVHDFGLADGYAEVRLVAGSAATGGGGLVIRWTDVNNFWRVIFPRLTSGDAYYVQKCVAGGYSTPVIVSGDASLGDRLGCLFVGSRLRLFVNDRERGAVTDAHNLNATRHGVMTQADAAWRLSGFRFFGRDGAGRDRQHGLAAARHRLVIAGSEGSRRR